MYHKVTINETGRNTLRDEPETFNVVVKTFKALNEAREYLIDRYGSIPKLRPRNTIYQDPDAVPVGFLKSFWNKDWSHNSKSWYQTDWVTVTSVTEQPILVN